MSIDQLLAQFFALQEDRVQEYNALHESFKTMIDTKSETAFLQSIPERTQRFSKISKDVIDIEHQLQQMGDDVGTECARLIRVVQLGERSKLQATSQIQALRKAHEFKELQWHHSSTENAAMRVSVSPEEGFRAQLKAVLSDLDAAIAQINDALDEIRCIQHDSLF